MAGLEGGAYASPSGIHLKQIDPLRLERKNENTMRMSRILMLAASLTFTPSVIASAAEQPKVKDVSGLAEVDLEADEYYFEPAFLRGTPGQKLKLEIENESNTLHSFTIPEQKLDMDIPPKGKIVVEVTFPQSGLVGFFCKFHSALGMNGELLTGDAKPQAVRSPK
jgi:plastocyanin